jgi:NAD(P)-dependent dehydrogenase (short-subunit alcohol dehydrogenase family)
MQSSKTALVTGANSGIGLATVNKFLAAGHRVIAIYHTDDNNLSSISNQNLRCISAELSSEKGVDSLLTLLKETNIDILVNNAGLYGSYKDLKSTTRNNLESFLAINLLAPFQITQHFFHNMKSQGWGRIVNISSIGVKFGGNPASSPYSISKASLEAMTLSFSKDGADSNVLVNSLRVGVTNTKIHSNNPSKDMELRVQRIPMKRMAEPDEIANFIQFLSSEENSFTTGQTIAISGGE